MRTLKLKPYRNKVVRPYFGEACNNNNNDNNNNIITADKVKMALKSEKEGHLGQMKDMAT